MAKKVDVVQSYKEMIERCQENLERLFETENDHLKRTFFVRFLTRFNWAEVKFPNQELYNFTVSLQGREKKRYNHVDEVFEKWKTSFEPS